MADTSFPKLASSSWRESYEIENKAIYEAPKKEAVSFIYDNVKVSGGNHIDNTEYTFYGGWSNFAITEASNKIAVLGYLRGDEYLSSRASLMDAFKVKTDDENPAFIFLPLWGRLRVVLENWNIEEQASENGQCKIELNFNLSLKDKNASIVASLSLDETSNNLLQIAESKLEESSNKMSFASFVDSVNEYASNLSSVVGKVQGKAEYINKMSNSINTLTNTIASGTRSISIYAQALNNLVASVVNGLLEIKQAAIENADDSLSFVYNILPEEYAERNIRKTIISFSKYAELDTSANLVKQNEIDTAKASDNFIKIIIITNLATLIAQEENKSTAKNYIALFDRLYNSINKDTPTLNLALTDLRVAMINELENKNLEITRKIKFNKNNNLLNIEHYLKCYKLRKLNFIEDSFCLDKEIIYS